MEDNTISREYPLTIRELNHRVRDCLEGRFPLTWVGGEISNFTAAASGHLYFSLKDDEAQVRCVVWRNKAQLLGWRPENGQRVEARVLVTLYEPRGEFQLNVETLRRAGQGEWFRRFLELKGRLEAEGLFALERKRPLPSFPRSIAIVTSPQAAALRDVLTTLRRRAPHLALTLYPTPVQGEGAAAGIAIALARASGDGHDLTILCRGGGSIEDLWPFNEEVVARAIISSSIPVISGVGHETDVTIADFAADQRAPTPTAAAEMACPERDALLERLERLRGGLHDGLLRRLMRAAQSLDWLAGRLVHPRQQLAEREKMLASLLSRMEAARALQASRHLLRLQAAGLRLRHAGASLLFVPGRQVHTLAASLRQLNPLAVLERGYAVVYDEAGNVVRAPAQVRIGEMLHITVKGGAIRARVQS